MHRRFRRLAVVAAAATAAITIAACSSSGSPSSTGSTSSGPVTITFWTWLSTSGTQALANEFTKTHPDIKVKVVDEGTSAAEYTKLDTALKAGVGAPDVAQIEYFALPQFVLSKEVVNLEAYGAASLKSKYSASAWDGVDFDNGIWGYPQDTGPMAMFYRVDLFKKAGISSPPTTWAQFAADAAIIHAKLPNTYMANMDPTDPGTATSLMWQAGATPFKSTGSSDVSVDLSQPGVQDWSNLWSGLLEKHLVSTDVGWTTSWWSAMAAGKYATWITGAWAPAPLLSNIPKTAGDWAVAPMPQWTAGANVTANNGGSSNAVLSTSPYKKQAAEFAAWLNSTPTGAAALASTGLFPSTTALLSSPSFLNATVSILGKQTGNTVLAQSSGEVASGWEYLPFQVYANSVYQDTVGQDISAYKSLTPGLQAWQQRIVSYGQSEGFTMTTGS
jgi:multiple sugar transport system substrate-binding protein